jgi:transcriptional antiterminator NusG
MKMDDEGWYVVRNTPGVTGFVSAEDDQDKRPKPVPLEEAEVQAILQQMESSKPRVRLGFEKGQNVRITDGPFVDFMGAVDEVYPDRSKVKILVSFFGRETPVELDFLQVEKS